VVEEIAHATAKAPPRPPRFAAEPIDVGLCFGSFLQTEEIVRLLDERLATLVEADAEIQ
jgi:hypothetical protein